MPSNFARLAEGFKGDARTRIAAFHPTRRGAGIYPWRGAPYRAAMSSSETPGPSVRSEPERKTIRELADGLDPDRCVQIHRSAMVNLRHVSQFSHGPGDAGEVHLKGRAERLAVSRSYVHLFRQM